MVRVTSIGKMLSVGVPRLGVPRPEIPRPRVPIPEVPRPGVPRPGVPIRTLELSEHKTQRKVVQNLHNICGGSHTDGAHICSLYIKVIYRKTSNKTQILIRPAIIFKFNR